MGIDEVVSPVSNHEWGQRQSSRQMLAWRIQQLRTEADQLQELWDALYGTEKDAPEDHPALWRLVTMHRI